METRDSSCDLTDLHVTEESSKMGRCWLGVCAVAAITAFVLFALGTSTEHWVNVSRSGGSTNPMLLNTQLASVGAANIEYAASHFGLWTACYREKRGALSCAAVGLRCGASVCWTQRGSGKTRKRVCQRARVSPIARCAGYQLARLGFAGAAPFALLGVAMLVVGATVSQRTLAMLGGIVMFASAVFMLAGFAFFYVEQFVRGGVRAIAHIGWSMWLVIIAWPLMLFTAIFACCAASLGEPYRDISEYKAVR